MLTDGFLLNKLPSLSVDLLEYFLKNTKIAAEVKH